MTNFRARGLPVFIVVWRLQKISEYSSFIELELGSSYLNTPNSSTRKSSDKKQ